MQSVVESQWIAVVLLLLKSIVILLSKARTTFVSTDDSLRDITETESMQITFYVNLQKVCNRLIYHSTTTKAVL